MTKAAIETTCGLTFIAAVLAAVALGLAPLVPPDAAPADAPATEFSASRAWKHVAAVAAAPHPVGSEAHAAVREYIGQQIQLMGLDAAVQEVESTINRRGQPAIPVTVRNIVMRLPGSQTSKAVLLVAHYDSTASSPGASDNASGVATLLESARALRARPPLRNDVIFLFSDAEEVGLLGARAFVQHHPLASRVGLVVNFDARGSGGPAVMFETGAPHASVLPTFAQAAPYPIATSLSEEVYRWMPNTTDFTIFKRAGYAGLNFALFAERRHYHNASDSIEHVDARSLQHQGANALAMARAFGDADLRAAAAPRGVYFNVGRSLLLRYPGLWAILLAGAGVLAWLAMLVVGLMRGTLTLRGLLLGAGTAIVAVVGAAVIGFAAQHWLADAMNVRRSPVGVGALYLAASAALVILAVTIIYRLTWHRVKPVELITPVLGVWIGLAGAASLMLPGASYLFTWPALAGLACLGITLWRGRADRVDASAGDVWLAAGAPVAALLLTPVVLLVYGAMGPLVTVGVMVCVALIVGLLVPAVRLVAATAFWPIPVAAAVTVATLIVLAASVASDAARVAAEQQKADRIAQRTQDGRLLSTAPASPAASAASSASAAR